MKALAKLALEQTGSIDVWVNNAGVTCFAPLDSERFDDHRAVLEINLFGVRSTRDVAPRAMAASEKRSLS